MSRLLSSKPLCLFLASVMLTGNTVFAGSGVEIRSNDISLNHGVLVGSVVNTSARPVSGIRVQLLHQNSLIATAVSDDNGQFVVKSLRNGGHVLQIGTTQQPVRFWSQQSAPPAAAAQMSIVVDEEVVRGQGCGEDCNAGTSILSSMASNPVPLLLLGGAVAATIAISNSQDDDASP